MSHTPRLLPIALLGAVTALAGCAGSDTAAEQGATAGSTPSAATAPAPSTPPVGTATGDPSGHGGHGGHSPAPTVATGGPKPARRQVVAGLQQYYQGIARVTGVPEHRYDTMSTCVVDALYDKAQVQTMNALQAGALTRVHPSDGPQVAQVTADCAQASVPGAAPAGPSGAPTSGAPGSSGTGTTAGGMR